MSRQKLILPAALPRDRVQWRASLSTADYPLTTAVAIVTIEGAAAQVTAEIEQNRAIDLLAARGVR